LHEGHRWILFEERISSGPGRIAAVEVGPSGVIGTPIPVLERPYHLSYPFIFEWDGTTYMVPETEENRTVELSRAEEFPTRWTLDRVLLAGLRAVDGTLAQIDGRWWMFVNIAESEESRSTTNCICTPLTRLWARGWRIPGTCEIRCSERAAPRDGLSASAAPGTDLRKTARVAMEPQSWSTGSRASMKRPTPRQKWDGCCLPGGQISWVRTR
jgi:hypothetical protein